MRRCHAAKSSLAFRGLGAHRKPERRTLAARPNSETTRHARQLPHLAQDTLGGARGRTRRVVDLALHGARSTYLPTTRLTSRARNEWLRHTIFWRGDRRHHRASVGLLWINSAGRVAIPSLTKLRRGHQRESLLLELRRVTVASRSWSWSQSQSCSSSDAGHGRVRVREGALAIQHRSSWRAPCSRLGRLPTAVRRRN